MAETVWLTTSEPFRQVAWQRPEPGFDVQAGKASLVRGQFFSDQSPQTRDTSARLDELKASIQEIAARHVVAERRFAHVTQNYQAAVHRLDTLFIPEETGAPVY